MLMLRTASGHQAAATVGQHHQHHQHHHHPHHDELLVSSGGVYGGPGSPTANGLHAAAAAAAAYGAYASSSSPTGVGGVVGQRHPGASGAAAWPVPSCILEMRKEKSRDAARSRRGKENYEFYELAKLLPLPAAITSQLDKASIIRLTISYLRLRDFSQHGDNPWSSDKLIKCSRPSRSVAVDMFEQHQGTHILQSLDGFAFALGCDGRFLYISETVSIYLGLSQVEMTGSTIFDYVHQQDHAEIAEQLGIQLPPAYSQRSPSGGHSPSAVSDDGSNCGSLSERPTPSMMLNTTPCGYRGLYRSFCIRMKSTLTKRGCHFKSSGYRVVLVLCHLRPQYPLNEGGKSRLGAQQPQSGLHPLLGMVAIAVALPPPSVNEVRLECDMFVSRLNFDFRIAHCEPRAAELLDYTADELTGRNMYTLVYAQDVEQIRKMHCDLMQKGQVMSGYYRLMNKQGGFTWLQTCATVICSTKNADEQSIICVNYVISRMEQGSCILDVCQLPGFRETVKSPPEDIDRNSSATPSKHNDIDAESSPKAMASDHSGTPITSPPTIINSNGGPAAHHRSPSPSYEILDVNKNHSQRGGVISERHPVITTKSAKSRKRNRSSADRSASPKTSRRSKSPLLKEEDNLSRPWKNSGGSGVDSGVGVRSLEDAMKRHLPPNDATTVEQSKIQWIGGGHGTMPATSLLRHLYVNRESVIRTGSHVTTRTSYYDQDGQPPEIMEPTAAYPAPSEFLLPTKDTYGMLSTVPHTPYNTIDPGTYTAAGGLGRDKLAFASYDTPPPPSFAPTDMSPYHSAIYAPLKQQMLVSPTSFDTAYTQAQALQEQQKFYQSGFQLYHSNRGPNTPPTWGSGQPQ